MNTQEVVENSSLKKEKKTKGALGTSSTSTNTGEANSVDNEGEDKRKQPLETIEDPIEDKENNLS